MRYQCRLAASPAFNDVKFPGTYDAWLDPDPENLGVTYAILDDRAQPYYEHQLVA